MEGVFGAEVLDRVLGKVRTAIATRSFPFSDANRAFYLMVAVGPSASDETRAEVFAVVERLRFDERREVNRAEIAPSPSEPACIPRGNGHARICVINETPTRTYRRKLELARSGSGAEPAEG